MAIFFTCLPLRNHVTLFLKRVQRWQISWIRSIAWFVNPPYSHANSSCCQGEVLENSFYLVLILWMATVFGSANVMGHPFFCYFGNVNTLKIAGEIFWKLSSNNFRDVTASFFNSVEYRVLKPWWYKMQDLGKKRFVRSCTCFFIRRLWRRTGKINAGLVFTC